MKDEAEERIARTNMAPFILFLFMFAWGLTRIAPGCYFGDCGEVLAAIFAGGVPHPTGFPAYLAPATLLARGGRSAYWVHVLSVASAAVCGVLLYDLARRLSGSRLAGWIASLVLFSSGTFLVHAAVARVYPLNLAFLLAFLWTGVLPIPAPRKAAWLGLWAGLGLSTHLTFLAGPVVALVLHWKDRRSWAAGVPLFAMGFLLAMSLYLWLPLRAALDPSVNWGDPDQAGRFWDYLRQAEYRNKMFTRGWDGLILFYRTILGAFARDWVFLHWIAAAGGAVLLGRRDPALGRALGAGVLFLLLLFSAYGSERDLHVMYRYFVPVYPLTALAAAWGYRAFRERLGAPGFRGDALTVLAVALLAAFSAHPWRGLSGSLESHDFAANVMKTLPRGSCLLLDRWADNQIYPLAYGRYLYGWRQDVIIAELGGKLFPEADREVRRRGDPNPGPLMRQWLVVDRRPVFMGEAAPMPQGLVQRQEGLLYRMAVADHMARLGPAPDLWDRYRDRVRPPRPPDREGEETWVMPLLARARWEWARGDREGALRWLKKVRETGAHSAPALGNAAILCLEMGATLQAQGFIAEAARLQPRYAAGLVEERR